MADQITFPKQRNTDARRSWHGMAFIMEALVLMVFLVISTAILLQVFESSRAHNNEASSLSYAAVLASNDAELFHVSPISDNEAYFDLKDGVLTPTEEPSDKTYILTRTVRPQQEANGVLYYADIKVEQSGEVLYELNSARYVSSSEVA